VIQSVIDLTLASPLCVSKIFDWKVDPDIIPRSVHLAISFRIGGNSDVKKVPNGKRVYSTNHGKWVKFKAHIIQEIGRLNVLHIIKSTTATTNTIDKAINILITAS